MRSVEQTRPRPGLSVPIVSVLDSRGELLEAGQRTLVRHVIQDGWGADIVFAAGTTGESDRVPAELSRRVVQVCAEEVKKANAAIADSDPVECWAGTTAPTRGAAEAAQFDAAFERVRLLARELLEPTGVTPRGEKP